MNYKLIIADIKNTKILVQRLQDIQNEIAGIDHAMYGIHSCSFDDVIVDGKEIRQYYHGGYVTEEQKANRMEMLTRQKKRLENEHQSINYRLDLIRYVMSNVPKETKDIINFIYVKGRSWEEANKKYLRSNSSLQNQIMRDIEAL